MIRLYTFPEAFGLRNVSPFCLKVEMALTHLGFDFDIEFLRDPRKAPKGKLPFVVFDSVQIADSEIILEYLDSKSDGALFADVTAQERARGLAFTRLAEDHLYWLMVASRWLDESWFPHVKAGFFGYIPGPLRGLVSGIARAQVRKTYNLHGLGRHTLAEQKDFARRDLRALSDAVGSSGYIAGDRLTAYDFAVAGLLAGMIDNQPSTWVSQLAADYPQLHGYAERVQQAVGVYGRILPNSG